MALTKIASVQGYNSADPATTVTCDTGGPYTKFSNVPATPTTSATSYGPTANLCGGMVTGQKYVVNTSVDGAGNESGWSNEVPFVFDVAAPAAPTNLTVQ
jgi:hypothetical protein